MTVDLSTITELEPTRGYTPPPIERVPPDGRVRTLLMVARRQSEGQLADFRPIARLIRDQAPDVRPIALSDMPHHRLRPGLALRPTLVFAPRSLRWFRPWRGRVFTSGLITKSQEYRALEAAGVSVPRWALVTPDHTPDLSDFGPYVVTKPDFGRQGADVCIMRAGRVRWRPPKHAKIPGAIPLIVQQFIYTGPWPTEYRVQTLFGHVLFAKKTVADRSRPPMPADFAAHSAGGGFSIVASGRGATMQMIDDPQIIDFARRAAAAMPDVPLLGIDILRRAPDGELFVTELNATGNSWHFSSEMGRRAQQQFGLDFQAQFGAFARAAAILIDQTRRHAR